MSITQNGKIRRITDLTLVVGADIAKKVHVARACDVRGVELGKPLTFDNTRHGFVRLITWIQSLMVDHSCNNVVFGVEPTGCDLKVVGNHAVQIRPSRTADANLP